MTSHHIIEPGIIVEPDPAGWLEPKWYVLFVRTNQEKRVADRLLSGDIEHYLPCYSSMRQWKDRRVKLEMPLFPGYVFVRMPFMERMKVLTLPNVSYLLGAKNAPSAVSEDEITQIRLGIEHGTAQPHPYLREGQRVRIREGIMTGMEGILLRTQNSNRVVVSLDSISRAFVVEIDGASLENCQNCQDRSFGSQAHLKDRLHCQN
jgi:transcription antitermination factor NusG